MTYASGLGHFSRASQAPHKRCSSAVASLAAVSAGLSRSLRTLSGRVGTASIDAIRFACSQHVAGSVVRSNATSNMVSRVGSEGRSGICNPKLTVTVEHGGQLLLPSMVKLTGNRCNSTALVNEFQSRPPVLSVPVGVLAGMVPGLLPLRPDDLGRAVAVSSVPRNETALIRLVGEVISLSRQDGLRIVQLNPGLALQRLPGLSFLNRKTNKPDQSREVRAGRLHLKFLLPIAGV